MEFWKYSVAALALAMPAAAQDRAEFTVTSEIAAPDSGTFTATINEIGNGATLSDQGGMEPVVYRTMFLATKGSPDTILADPATLSNWNSWTNGTFDGAEVEILRIEDGRFVSVRTGHVPEGGHSASTWTALNGGKPVAGTELLTGWDGYNRAGAPYYYTVRTVDRRGNLSPAAPAVSIVSPEKPGQTPDIETLDVEVSDEASSLTAPQGLQGNLLREGIARLRWQPVDGAQGYVVYRADLPESEQRGHSIKVDGDGPDIRAGDLVMLRQKLTEFDRTKLASNRVWGAQQVRQDFLPGTLRDFPDAPGTVPWSLVPHDADTPVEDAGETFLRADLAPNRRFEIGPYNHAGTSQTWYQVLDPAKTYRFEAWMRSPTPATAAFTLDGPYNGKIPNLPARFELTPEWQKYSVEFRVPDIRTDKTPGRMTLGVQTQSATQVDIDNFRIYVTDAPYLAFTPEDATALKESGMSALRTHSFVKLHERTYDLTQLTDAGGLGSVGGGNTLPQTLDAISSVGMDPWLQIQPHLSRDEWLGLAEYLAAPATADAPLAMKRAAQGQDAPYTDAFDRIYFEIGNETWNGLFDPWIFKGMDDAATGQHYNSGEVYGLYQEYVLSILSESPHWPVLEPMLLPVLGGWGINSYGFDAARMSPRSRILTHANYIGGWDSGEGPVSTTPEGYASVLAFTPQSAGPGSAGKMEELRALRGGDRLMIGTYESGPGYALNGLNGENVTPEQAAAQEKVMKSAATGTATLDAFLAQMRNGFTIQNYFTFARGDYWKSHAPWYNGGQAYPSWAWLALANRELMGDMLTVRTNKAPLRDLPENSRRQPVDDAPMVDVYALRRGDRLSIVAVSRLIPEDGSDGHSAVTVDLPITAADKVTRYHMTGDYMSQNLTENAARIVAEDVASPALPLEIDLPPGATLVYVFDGVR